VRSNNDGNVQFSEFLELARRFPLATFPLFQFQVQLQNATLGTEKWLAVRDHVDLVLEAAADPVAGGKPAK
jgi:hypothetical protein